MSIEFKSVQVSVDTLSTMYSTHCEALQREKDASQALMQERDALTAAIARQLKTNGMLKQEISRQQRVSVQLSAAHTVLLSEYRQLKQAVSGARVL